MFVIIRISRATFVMLAASVVGFVVGVTLAPYLPWPADLVGPDVWPLIFGHLVGGYFLWRLGSYLNDDDEAPYRFLAARIEYWGLAGLVVGLAMFGYLAWSRHERTDAETTAVSPPICRVTSVVRRGANVGDWLFVLADEYGVRKTVKVGDTYEPWTVAVPTNGFLVLVDPGSGRRTPLRLPRER